MKRSRILNLALAASLGAAAGLPLHLEADDTEIYLGDHTLADGVRPNVLFILDTSGSMSGTDGQATDRLDRMKEALRTVLDEANNINVGLMRFTDPGGPILFPVSYIDDDVSIIEAGGGSGSDVNVQIKSSGDDAEQLVASGAVDLVSDRLDLVAVTDAVDSTPFDAQVSSQSNNAEEELSDGDVITGSQIDMSPSQINAFRFTGVTVPAGATILDARLVFRARNSDSSSTALTIRGELSPNPGGFPTSCNDCSNVASRPTTGAALTWNPPSWSSDNWYSTDDISSVVQQLVDQPGWAPGNAMVFIQTNGGSGQRRAYSYSGSSWRAPRLEITYATTVISDNQIVGLRFQNVDIPQGATITSAVIEFWPADTGSTDTDIVITGQAHDDAPAFSAATNNLGVTVRARTAASTAWNDVPAWDELEIVRQTPDLTGVVQEIVDRGGWCGNNAMAFFLELNGIGNPGPRIGETFDHDPSRAPRLRINFDESSVAPDACINQWVQRQVETNDDDAEETLGSGSVSTGGSSLDMTSSQVNGLRFQNIPISQGTTILEARLIYTARDIDSGAAQLSFSAEDADDTSGFSNSLDDISDRVKTTASVTWNPDDWDITGEQHVTSDLRDVIQEVISRPGWSEGNSLVILQEHDSGAQRRAHTFNGNAAFAPRLRIKVQGALATGGAGFKTVRARLKEIIDDLDHQGHTPIVDTLFEAARYYRGDTVHWGLTRGFDRAFGDFNAASTNDAVRRNTRVSHPASYVDGFVYREPGCTDGNLNADACKSEMILGAARYISPMSEICQANHIVLLTDGEANHNDSEALIKSYIPTASCISSNADEACARDIVEWMHTADQNASLTGDQTVTTYTIGFNFSGDLLRDIASLGGGQFYEASTANELANVFKAIIADILSRTTSFATPSLSVNAFNRLFHRNEVYFSLFKPNARALWKGNTKKYALCQSEADGCSLGQVLDANGQPAIGADNRIKDEAESFWSGSRDGAEVEVGGAGNEIPPHISRRVYTYTGADAPDNEILDADAHEIPDSNTDLTKELLGDALMSDTERTELIDWIRGRDIDDEDSDGDTDENRYAFHDPLHSSPVAVTYGGTQADPVIKLFVGTNDGALRMINAANGEEEWIFYPQVTLARQATLRANPTGDHVYGIDGTPTVWMNDENRDGIVDPTLDFDGDGIKEFVRVFVGMRRGGEDYYALDVTPSEATGPLTDPQRTTDVSPRLMWRLEGDSTEFPRLGQSWSRPKLAPLRVGTLTEGQSVLRTLLVIGGGYDEAQDTAFTSGGLGNAIYVIDPLTGARLFWVSSHDHGDNQGVVVPDMTYPIPSDVAMIDADGDFTTERLYVGDLGGQVWRIEFRPDLTAVVGMKATVGKLAMVSDPAEPEDHRKIFYPPDVVQVTDVLYSDVGRYDMVTVVTGNRAHPLDTTVQDRFYALRDVHVAPLVDGVAGDPSDDDGLADGYTTLQGETVAAPGDLFDVTTIHDPEGDDLADLQAANGFALDLTANGEKGLAPPIVLAGTVFFTTYLPDGVVSATTCALAEGSGLLYGINLLNGAAAFNWDGVGDDITLSASDRTYTLGGGIPSGAVPIFQPEGITLLVGGGGGATAVDPNLTLPRGRTFWFHDDT